jgi:hypothetical protein
MVPDAGDPAGSYVGGVEFRGTSAEIEDRAIDSQAVPAVKTCGAH